MLSNGYVECRFWIFFRPSGIFGGFVPMEFQRLRTLCAQDYDGNLIGFCYLESTPRIACAAPFL